MGCCFMTVCLSDGLLFLSGGQPSLSLPLQHLSHLPLLSPLEINQEVYASCSVQVCVGFPPTHPPGLLGSLRFQTPPDRGAFQTLFILWLSLGMSSWNDAGFSSSSESRCCMNALIVLSHKAPQGVFLSLSWKCDEEEEEERILQVRKWCNKCISVNKTTDLGCFFWLVYVFVTSLTHVLLTCVNQFHQNPNCQRSVHPKVEFWESRWIMTHHSHLGQNKIRIWRKTLERWKCTAFISI